MQLKKLQYVQNTAARIITQTCKFAHITPVLLDQFTGFLLVMLVFKSLNNLSASYLADRQLHSRNLWSTSKQLLEQRQSFTKLTATRLFQCMPQTVEFATNRFA